MSLFVREVLEGRSLLGVSVDSPRHKQQILHSYFEAQLLLRSAVFSFPVSCANVHPRRTSEVDCT